MFGSTSRGNRIDYKSVELIALITYTHCLLFLCLETNHTLSLLFLWFWSC